MSVDLTVEIKTDRGSLVLRNPIMPGASEVAVDENTVTRCIEYGAGAVLTKSFGNVSSPGSIKTSSRPWAFPLDRFGPAYRGAWVFNSAFFAPEETPEKIAERHIPKWKQMCQDAGVPLIVSVCDEVDENWPYFARLFEDAGADALELDASCPGIVHVDPLGDGNIMTTFEDKWADDRFAAGIIKKVKAATTVPVGAKFGLFHNPLAVKAKVWEGAGVNFIGGHNALPSTGVFVDEEAEEVYGTPGQSFLCAGPTMVPLSLSRLAQVLAVVDIPVIGVGGIYTAADVVRYLLLGCSAVQVASAAYFKGHQVFAELATGLAEWMQRHGYTHVDQFRGKLLKDATCVRGDWERKYGYRVREMPRGMLMADQYPSPVVARFDTEKCIGCNPCKVACLYGAIGFDDERGSLVADERLCEGCGMCVGLCQLNPGVVWLEDKRTGQMVWDGVGTVKTFKLGGYSLD